MNAQVNQSGTPTEIAHQELSLAYAHFNDALLGGDLPFTLMTLQRTRATQGLFTPDRFINSEAVTVHEIAINPQIFAMSTIKEVLAVVVHEMVHVYAHQHGLQGRRGYHSSGWADKMEAVGLMPSTTGQPGGKRVGERVAHYIIPGGPFDQAADALIATGYTITWLDRIAAYWYDAETAADGSRTREPLGGALLGKVGLLVPHAETGQDPVHEREDAKPADSEIFPELPRALEHHQPTSQSTLDDEAVHPHVPDAVPQASDAPEAYDPTLPVILVSGSKPRSGETPRQVKLIETELDPKSKQTEAERRKGKEKVRFTCPSCDQRAWAKPAASLKCGTCDLVMQASESGSRTLDPADIAY